MSPEQGIWLKYRWIWSLIILLLVATMVLILLEQSGDADNPGCEGIAIDLEKVCRNMSLSRINNMAPTLDLSVINRGAEMNGLMVFTDGKPAAKLFRTVESGGSHVLQVPFSGPAKSVSVRSLIVRDGEVIYCKMTERVDVLTC
jgi:hypothetical protein